VTVGNAYTGNQATAAHGTVTGPGGNTYSGGAVHGDQGGVAKVNGNYYADHDGNIYSNTGNGWQKYVGGSGSTWQGASSEESKNLDQQSKARSTGDQRWNDFSNSNFGNKDWGGGGNRSYNGGGGWGGRSGGWGGGGGGRGRR
jgi:hypothetical protein